MAITGAAQAVSFTLPATTGGTAPVSVACSPASGSAFPLGTTTVTCTATDASSRTAVCGFDVVAKGTQLGAKKFLAVGDSTTEGENGLGAQPLVIAPKWDDTPNAYPVKLQALFDASFPNQGITVTYPSGIGGTPALQSLANLPGYLNGAHPDALLVLTGYNDVLTSCGIGYVSNALCDQAIDDVEAGVRGIIRTAQAFPGVRYVFVGTLTPGHPGQRYIDPLRVQDANEHIRNVVSAEGATLVDIYPLFLGHESTYVSPDGLHLLPPGYQAMAQAFFDKILATVPQVKPQSIGLLRGR